MRFGPSEDQQILLDATVRFLEKECPRDVVRRAEPSGFSPELLRHSAQLGLIDLALTEELDTLALIVNAFGRYCAPMPVVEPVIAARVLSRAGTECAELLDSVVRGDQLVLAGPGSDDEHLVPYGIYADRVVTLGASSAIVEAAEVSPCVAGLGLPGLVEVKAGFGCRLTFRDGAGPNGSMGLNEWRALSACWLVGIGQAALADATAYAKRRKQFGVPIGSFQAVAHLLADAQVDLLAANYLALEAAWAADHEPDRFGVLSMMAYVTASRAAQHAAAAALHVHGGYGFVLDSDAQVFYRRAKAWGVLLGSPEDEYSHLADELGVGIRS